MELNGIKPADGAKHAKRRVGRGIGFDQLLIVEAPSNPDVDFRYRS